MTFALITLAIALTVPGVVVALRALPPVARRVLDGQKPWACNICMTFWTTAIATEVAAAAVGDWRVVWLAGPAYTIALVLLERVVEAAPAAGPPDLPALDDEGAGSPAAGPPDLP